MRCVKVVIADRHPLVLSGLASLLSVEKNIEIVATCRDGTKCIEVIQNASPDIALVDILMPGVSGLEALIAASAVSYTQVVFLAVSAGLRRLIVAGGGYRALRGEATLVRCLRQIIANRRLIPIDGLRRQKLSASALSKTSARSLALLTARERQIVRLVSDGLSNKEVGRQLNISEGTVKIHLHHIYEKLAINNRTSLVTLATHHSQPDAVSTKAPILSRRGENSE